MTPAPAFEEVFYAAAAGFAALEEDISTDSAEEQDRGGHLSGLGDGGAGDEPSAARIAFHPPSTGSASEDLSKALQRL